MDKVNSLARALPEQSNEAEAWLSALYDGELVGEPSPQALARLVKNAEASHRWAEYSLIGDALRGLPVRESSLTARVSAALANEPTVLAPMPAKATEAIRPAYWLAAAAAVATIAWTVTGMAPESHGNQPLAPMAANMESTVEATNGEMAAYLAAHQDYAYALVGETDMRLTTVSLAGAGR